MHQVTHADELAQVVRQSDRVRVAGGGTKPAVSRDANVSLAGCTGVVEYEASEFTITVRAGTTLAQIAELLAAERQYLPFDPPLVEAGATIGGTVAAGLSGSGRFRYGGVRDFLLGVQFVTGEAQVVRMGSRVVKNAAGFDLPKLMVGSLGRYGLMTELTLKVFPQPEAAQTLVFEASSAADAMQLLLQLAAAPFDLDCLDLHDRTRVSARIAGQADALPARAERLQQLAATAAAIVSGDDEADLWRDVREFRWSPAGHILVKVALAPREVFAVAAQLESVPHRIAAGGHLLWIAWPPDVPRERLEQILPAGHGIGLALTGPWSPPRLGQSAGDAFARRLGAALDPLGKFSFTPSDAPP